MNTNRTAASYFRDLGPRARLHTSLRWRTSPLATVARTVPMRGEVLDFGCGHGLLAIHLALASPHRRIHAVDPDGDKLELGRRAAEGAGVADRIIFERVGPDWSPGHARYDAVVIVDVLYLLPAGQADRVLGQAVGSLRTGAVLVVKEMADGPRWKRMVVHAQEHLSLHVAGITHGTGVNPVPERQMVTLMEAAGLAVTRHDLGVGGPWPHLLLVARNQELDGRVQAKG